MLCLVNRVVAMRQHTGFSPLLEWIIALGKDRIECQGASCSNPSMPRTTSYDSVFANYDADLFRQHGPLFDLWELLLWNKHPKEVD